MSTQGSDESGSFDLIKVDLTAYLKTDQAESVAAVAVGARGHCLQALFFCPADADREYQLKIQSVPEIKLEIDTISVDFLHDGLNYVELYAKNASVDLAKLLSQLPNYSEHSVTSEELADSADEDMFQQIKDAMPSGADEVVGLLGSVGLDKLAPFLKAYECLIDGVVQYILASREKELSDLLALPVGEAAQHMFLFSGHGSRDNGTLHLERIWPSQSKRSKPAILIADDDEGVLEIISNILEDSGLEILTAEDGLAAALVYFANPGIRYILTDIVMPNLEGFELVAVMNALHHKKGHQPVMAVTTGYTTKEKIMTAKSLGIKNWLVKPIDHQKLLDLVERMRAR